MVLNAQPVLAALPDHHISILTFHKSLPGPHAIRVPSQAPSIEKRPAVSRAHRVPFDWSLQSPQISPGRFREREFDSAQALTGVTHWRPPFGNLV